MEIEARLYYTPFMSDRIEEMTAIWKVETGDKMEENHFAYLEDKYKAKFTPPQKLVLSEKNNRQTYYVAYHPHFKSFTTVQPTEGSVRWIDQVR